MRQIFEYLMIGKFMFLKKDNHIAEKWLNAHQFDVYDKVIKLLKSPPKNNFHDFWIYLCNMAHASTQSFQMGIENRKSIEDLTLSYRINMIFLVFKNRLLQECFLNQKLKYRSEKYGFKKGENKEIRAKLKALERKIVSEFTDSSLALVNDYKKNWEFKK
jgi:hypothetical protein